MDREKEQVWDSLRIDTAERMNTARKIIGEGKIFPADKTVALLEAVIKPGDKVNLEGNNQKQADFLADCLCKVDPAKIGLTERQREVLRLMSRGKSNRDIAGLLGLSEGTVKVHLTAIFKALGVSSRTQALVAITQQGIRL